MAILTGVVGAADVEEPYGLPHRALALLLLENDGEFIDMTSEIPGWETALKVAAELRHRIEEEHGQPAAQRIAGERHGLAGLVAAEVETRTVQKQLLGERLWEFTTAPRTGVP